MARNIEKATFSIKKPKKQDLEMERNVKMQVWSYWKDGICDNDFDTNRHLSPPDRFQYLKQMLVIFEDSGPFLIVPCKTSGSIASWTRLAHIVQLTMAKRNSGITPRQSPSKLSELSKNANSTNRLTSSLV